MTPRNIFEYSLGYSEYWRRSENLLRSPVSRVYSQSSWNKPYLDDKHKSQPHRYGATFIAPELGSENYSYRYLFFKNKSLLPLILCFLDYHIET